MGCRKGMMSGSGKLLFRDLWLLDVSHDEFLMDVVSIPSLLRIRMSFNVVNYLSDQRRRRLASRKGKGKCMVNQLEEMGQGT